MLFTRWIDKQTVVHPPSVEYCCSSIKRSKLLIHSTCIHLNGNAERKKPVSNRHIQCNFMHIIFTGRQNYSDRKQFSGYQWLKVEKVYLQRDNIRKFFWGDRTVLLSWLWWWLQKSIHVWKFRFLYSTPKRQFYCMLI